MHRPFFCSSYHFCRGFASLFWVKKGAWRVREGCREGHVRAAGNGDFSGEFPGAFSLRKLVNAPVFFSEYCWGKFLVDAVFFADDFGFGGCSAALINLEGTDIGNPNWEDGKFVRAAGGWFRGGNFWGVPFGGVAFREAEFCCGENGNGRFVGRLY